jgi:hypothetical protein
MPYYVFKIHPGKKLELVQAYDIYQEAKNQVRNMRAALTPADTYTPRVMFGKNPGDAEQLILTERPYQVIGEE